MIRNSGQFGILYLAAILVLATCIVPVSADNKLTVSGVILPSAAPVAAFTGAPLSGPAPLVVQFTDQSTGSPASWTWEYRKGAGKWKPLATTQNPSFTFATPGTYDVRLTVTNNGGSDSEIKSSYITVTPPVRPPVAIFTQDRYIGRAPLTVHFTDRSLGNPVTWEWRFGDGSMSDQKNPVHTYTTPGVYVVRERVTNNAGSDTAYSVVVVTRKNWWW